MRAAIAILTMLWASAPLAEAQSLAEIARRHRLERQARPPAVLVFTTESLESLYPDSPVEGEEGSEAAEMAGNDDEDEEQEARDEQPPEEDSGRDPAAEALEAAWLEWQEALSAQEEIVQDLEDREVELQLEINRQRGLYMAPINSQPARQQAMDRMTAAQTQLDGVRAELAAARALLSQLVATEPPRQP